MARFILETKLIFFNKLKFFDFIKMIGKYIIAR